MGGQWSLVQIQSPRPYHICAFLILTEIDICSGAFVIQKSSLQPLLAERFSVDKRKAEISGIQVWQFLLAASEVYQLGADIMIPKNISREHIIKAIKQIKKVGIPSGRSSRKFLLEYKGKSYPPKYIICFANKYANGIELAPQEFS